MSTDTMSFKDITKDEWIAVLAKELKGAPLETLHKIDEVEGLSFEAYMHQADATQPASDPGAAPFTRGTRTESNDWVIACPVYIRENQTDAELNSFILDQLMKGSTGIYIISETNRDLNFEAILKDVELQYIHTSFEAFNEFQANAFQQFVGSNPHTNVRFAKQRIVVDAYQVQQCGANAVQELAFALLNGHDQLVALLDSGMSVEEACANAQFNLGIGTKYLIETAKFRAFRWCWSTIVKQYDQNSPLLGPRLVAKSGFTHLSLKDQYTNLLRLTTQAMSAVNGGVDELIIQPYDAYSTHFNPTFSQRMSTNISLLLQEESYFSKVADVAGGAYAIERFTKELAEKAWELFKVIEAKGGLNEAKTELAEMIKKTATLRMQRITDKKDKLIGINIFPNPKEEEGNWTNVPGEWNGLPTLQLDRIA